MINNGQNVIILQVELPPNQEDKIEVWGSLTGLCNHYIELPYTYLSRKKYPFKWRNFTFTKVKYKVK